MSRRGVEIRAPREDDVAALLAEIRPADLAEGEALLGPGAVPAALAQSLRDSALAWTADTPDGLMCMFGVAPASLMGDQGLPWMVGTPRVAKYAGALTRLAGPYIGRMLAAFPLLVNVVDARNTRAIAFLKHAGFTVLPAGPVGRAGLPFHPFFMRRG
jgi:hypothetical protein